MSRVARIRTLVPQVEHTPEEENYYIVDLFENDRIVEIRELPGKSLSYAEDVAENWENGIIQLLTE